MNFNKTVLVLLASSVSCISADITEISNMAQYDQAIHTGRVVIKFWHHQCAPCRQIKTYFDSLAKDDVYKDIKFFSVNTMKVSAVTQRAVGQFGFNSVPTFVFLNNGKKVALVKGDRAGIKNALDALVKM